MNRNTSEKNCYCHTCEKEFHCLGIARHRAMHRDKQENCKISYTNGDIFIHEFAQFVERNMKHEPK